MKEAKNFEGKTIIKSIHPLYYLLLLLLISPIYKILNQSTTGAVDVTIFIDGWIPFIKEFIIPYILWYPFIYGALIYYCFVDRKQYFISLTSFILGKVICFFFYYFWQTTVPRPQLVGDDLFTNLVRFVYTTDQPVNCLPSIHVLTTFVIMIAAFNRKEANRWEYIILTLSGTLIIFSTMFTKQHSILDVLAGIIVSVFVYMMINAIYYVLKRFQLKSYKISEKGRDIHL